jgi:hypothetical protein
MKAKETDVRARESFKRKCAPLRIEEFFDPIFSQSTSPLTHLG